MATAARQGVADVHRRPPMNTKSLPPLEEKLNKILQGFSMK